MDPVSALGVAAAVIQFIDFSSKIISKSQELSETGQLFREARSGTLATTLISLNNDIIQSCGSRAGAAQPVSKTEQGLRRISEDCNDIAQKLISRVGKVDIRDQRRSKRLTFRKALESVWNKDELDNLEKQLSQYQLQTVQYIVVMIRADQSTFAGQIQVIKNEAQENNIICHKLLECLEGGQTKVDQIVQMMTTDAPSASLDSRRANFQAELMRSLWFENMKSREERVREAYTETYSWVLVPQNAPDARREDFVAWLRTDSDKRLYWITGKAGAGKSTLMKFIHHDEQLERYLREWASQHDLVKATFFFWNSGDEMQMSQTGLLRTLLYEALQQCKGAVLEIFSERWNMFDFLGIRTTKMSQAELKSSLQRLISTLADTCFFFLIDGLDEFSGDHTDLVEFVQRLAAHPNVKVCVSSRPWEVFQDAFETKPNLRLEDLTYSDMIHFVSKEFHNSKGYSQLATEDPKQAETLVHEIVSKARGVFLWVELVVKQLLGDLREGARLSDLRDHLISLPPDLEIMFQKMLDSIEHGRLEHASQIFQIVLTAKNPLKLKVLAFATESEGNAPFELPIQPLDDEKEKAKLERMSRRLNGYCKGLLEVNRHKLLKETSVEYLHRTVRDFFHQQEIWTKLKSQTRDSFDPRISICRGILMVVKCMSVTEIRDGHFPSSGNLNGKIGDLAGLFFSCAENLLEEIQDTQAHLFGALAETTDKIIESGGRCSTSGCWCHGPADHPGGPFLALATYWNYSPYVESRLAGTAPSLQKKRTKALSLLSIAQMKRFQDFSLESNFSARDNSIRVTKCLLEWGADPNLSLQQHGSPWHEFVNYERDYIGSGSQPMPTEVWIMFLKSGADPRNDLSFLSLRSLPGLKRLESLQKRLRFVYYVKQHLGLQKDLPPPM